MPDLVKEIIELTAKDTIPKFLILCAPVLQLDLLCACPSAQQSNSNKFYDSAFIVLDKQLSN